MGAQPYNPAQAQHVRGGRAAGRRVMRPPLFLPMAEAAALLLLAAALRLPALSTT